MGATGIEASAELTAFADAVIKGTDADRDAALEALVGAVGVEGAVDTAAVIANFQMMNRIADATGIPLDTPTQIASLDLQEALHLERYTNAANTPESSRSGKLLRRALAPIVRMAMPHVGKILPTGD